MFMAGFALAPIECWAFPDKIKESFWRWKQTTESNSRREWKRKKNNKINVVEFAWEAEALNASGNAISVKDKC